MTTKLAALPRAPACSIRRPLRRLAGAWLLVAAVLPLTGLAQSSYPSRPVRFVLGFPPGGTSDMVARAMGELLAEALGQPVVMDNRPGAAGKMAAEVVAKAPPDGHTLMFTSGSYAVAPSLHRHLPYDIQRDFIHVTLIANAPFMLALYPKLPANNLQELIAYARSNPGKVNFASAGVGVPSHLAGEVLAQMAKLDLTHVPYKGSALAMIDLIAGRVHFYFTSIPGALAHAKAGRVRPIAVTSTTRSPALPEVPTMAESGLKGYRAGSWYGLAFPRGVPPAIVTRVHAIVQKGLSAGGLEAKFVEQGLEIRRNVSPKEAAEFIREDVAYWAGVIKRAGIPPT
jgi:tripartite-type tricarboxylate transporter receptor subunit TctC